MCITNKQNQLWPCLWIFLIYFSNLCSQNSNINNKLSHWKYIGYMKANNGEPDVLTFTIPTDVSTLLVVYEDKAVFQPIGLAAPPLIIPLDQSDDRHYVANMYYHFLDSNG